MAKKQKPLKHPTYLVQMIDHRGEYSQTDIPDPARQTWAGFESEAKAKEFAIHLDEQYLLAHGYPQYGVYLRDGYFQQSLSTLTNMPEAVFRDWIEDSGVTPPIGNTLEDWQQWWQEVAKPTREISQEQFLHILRGMNQRPLHYFEVKPVETEQELPDEVAKPEVGYAIVHQAWEYGDDWYYGSNTAMTVFRKKQTAEDTAARLQEAENRRIRRDWNGGPNQFVIVEVPLEPEV